MPEEPKKIIVTNAAESAVPQTGDLQEFSAVAQLRNLETRSAAPQGVLPSSISMQDALAARDRLAAQSQTNTSASPSTSNSTPTTTSTE